ncbi:SWIB-domain-containing protein [Rhizopus microsporus]
MLLQRYNDSFYATDTTYTTVPNTHQLTEQHKRKIDELEYKKKPKSKKKKNKIVDPNAIPKPKRKTGLNKPLILSPVLSELMDGAKELSRPELVQKLWKYIKENNLQDPADRRFILCDAKLKKIFEQDRVNSFGMNKDLSAHLTKKEEVIDQTQQSSGSVSPLDKDGIPHDDFLLNLS